MTGDERDRMEHERALRERFGGRQPRVKRSVVPQPHPGQYLRVVVVQGGLTLCSWLDAPAAEPGHLGRPRPKGTR